MSCIMEACIYLVVIFDVVIQVMLYLAKTIINDLAFERNSLFSIIICCIY